MVSPPYGALSKVICERLLADDFLDVMLSAPVLEEFICCVESDPMSRHTDVVTHGHLQTLRLIDDSFTHFLRLVRLPALRKLHLAVFINDEDENRDVLSFLAHSSTSLRHFSTGMHMTTLSVEWFSDAMPYLTDIDISYPPQAFLHDFFKRLDRAQEQRFLPRLENLAFRSCAVDVYPSMSQALSSRCTADEEFSKLVSFRLNWRITPSGPDKPMITALQAFVEGGLAIFVGREGFP